MDEEYLCNLSDDSVLRSNCIRFPVGEILMLLQLMSLRCGDLHLKVEQR